MQKFKLKRSGTIAVQLVFLLFFNGKANAQTLPDVQFVKGMAGQDSILKVNILGNESIGTKEILNVLPFAIGDPYRKELEKQTAAVIEDYYRKRGFYSTKVNTSFNQQVDKTFNAEIRIAEGKPCNIKSFNIADPPGFKSKHIFLRFKDRMFNVAGVAVGERYDEEKVSNSLRQLREWLIDQDYILVNSDNVKLKYNDGYTEVDVFADVLYGERISFGYQNNSIFTKSELNEFISQIRTTGLGKDFLGLIQKKFTEEYKARAYNSIQIDMKISEWENLKHVTFSFKEGVRSKLESVKWDGLSEENRVRAETVFDQGVIRYVQRGYFVEKSIDKGIEIVLEDLKARGFLSCKFVAKTIQPVIKKDKNFEYVAALVQLSEGEQTAVGRITLTGFKHLMAEDVKSILQISEGKPFNPFALEEGIQKLQARYVSDGFLGYRLLTADNKIVIFGTNARIANVNLEIAEGPMIKIDQIIINGLDKTLPRIVERELTVHSDETWEAGKLHATETNLRSLGLFSDIKLKPESSPRGVNYRNLVISLKESDPGAFEAGPGFRSDLGLRAFSRVSYSNFLGKNWIGSMGAEVNRRVNDQYRFLEYRVDSAFIEPRFFGTKNLYSIGISTSKQRFPPNFNAVTTRFTTGFERKLYNDKIISKLYYKLERIRQFDVFINGDKFDIDNQTLLIGSVNPSVSYDTRDSPFTTTRGQISTLSLEYADPSFAGQSIENANATGYYKWVGGTHFYIPVSSGIIWSNVISGGFERSNIFNHPIPLIKLFRLGGYSSIRGYSEDSINADSEIIRGSLSYVNLRTQIDLPLVGELKLGPFLDAGNLFIDDKWSPRPLLKSGAGAGFHYVTPIGPVNLDYGVKLKPIENESPWQIHFSVGFI